MSDKTDFIEQIREFNRFYTAVIGILNRDYLNSGYSLTENRILFELSHNQNVNAIDLIEQLGVDKGYMSRIISGFEKKGIIERTQSAADGRRRNICLTPYGTQEAARVMSMASEKIAELIEPLDNEECEEMCKAMNYIKLKLT